jgi:transposase-like protein
MMPDEWANADGHLRQTSTGSHDPLASSSIRDCRLCWLGCNDAIVGQEFGKRNVEIIPVAEAQPDESSRVRATATPDLISVPENSWRNAVEKFEALRVLMDGGAKRTRAAVTRPARAIGKHPATIYRWIQQYKSSERLSVLLRQGRSDRGKSRLPSKVDRIIEAAIEKIYLTAESPQMAAVIEEVELQCFKHKIKKRPHRNRRQERRRFRTRIRPLADHNRMSIIRTELVVRPT